MRAAPVRRGAQVAQLPAVPIIKRVERVVREELLEPLVLMLEVAVLERLREVRVAQVVRGIDMLEAAVEE